MSSGVWLSNVQLKNINVNQLTNMRRCYEVKLNGGRRYFFYKKDMKSKKKPDLMPLVLLDEGYDNCFAILEDREPILIYNGDIMYYSYFLKSGLDLIKLPELNIEILSKSAIEDAESRLERLNLIETSSGFDGYSMLAIGFVFFVLFILGFIYYEN